jgi:hypothetical protein
VVFYILYIIKNNKEDMNNLINQNDFKKIKKGDRLVKEMVERIGDDLVVTMQVSVPQKLVKEYGNKVKTQTGRDILTERGDMIIAETLVRWVNQNLLTVENLGPDIVLGDQYDKGVQVQAGQAQDTAQDIPQSQGQAQDGQVQVQDPQGQGQIQVQDPQGQIQGGQGQTQSGQGQGQTQGGQGQTQGGQGQIQI